MITTRNADESQYCPALVANHDCAEYEESPFILTTDICITD